MKFPALKELATTNVIYIEIDSTIREGIELMLSNVHRNVIVKDGEKFRILMIADLVYIKKRNIDQNRSLRSLDLPFITALDKETNILACVEHLKKQIEYICTLNSDGSLHGIVTLTDIISHIDPDTLIENYTLREYLHLGTSIMEAGEEELVLDIFDRFEQSSFDSVVITRRNVPIGILTAKDILKALKSDIDLNIPARELMTSPVRTLYVESTIKEALEFINSNAFKRVIVIDSGGYLSGAITQKELISLTYNRWSQLIKEHFSELQEINRILLIENQQYKTRALTDQLTGLYNRHYFIELFDKRQKDEESRFISDTLLLIDIDNFKQINDNYGHNTGDKVLSAVSKTLINSLRGNDIAGRWGGEEFVVLLLMSEIEEAMEVAQKISRNIAALKVNGNLSVTVSIGINAFHGIQRLEDVISKADEALYEAKRSGRNCIRYAL